MKYQTKVKYFLFLVKLFKLGDLDKSRLNLMLSTTKTVQVVRARHRYPKRDIDMIGEDQIYFAMNMSLLEELQKGGAIKYQREIDKYTGDTIIEGSLMFVQ